MHIHSTANGAHAYTLTSYARLYTCMHLNIHMGISRCPHLYTFTHVYTYVHVDTHIHTLATTVLVSGREKGAEEILKTDSVKTQQKATRSQQGGKRPPKLVLALFCTPVTQPLVPLVPCLVLSRRALFMPRLDRQGLLPGLQALDAGQHIQVSSRVLFDDIHHVIWAQTLFEFSLRYQEPHNTAGMDRIHEFQTEAILPGANSHIPLLVALKAAPRPQSLGRHLKT